MKKKKNKILKASLAVMALTLTTGYVSQYPMVSTTYAQSDEEISLQKLIDLKTVWSYLDNNTDPGTTQDRYAWTKAGYDVSSWKSASGQFGSKNGAIADLGGGYTPTVLLNQYINGTDGDDIPAFFFRTTVQINKLDDLKSITGQLVYDDAAIIYINGVKVASFDEPSGGFESNMSYGGSNAGDPQKVDINISQDVLKDILKTGENVIAVEIHQGRASSSDSYFEMSQLQVNYGKEETIQKGVNLTVGEDEESMNITWYANSFKDGQLQIVKAAQLINGQFPQDATTLTVQPQVSNDNQFSYYQTTLSQLEENTKYAYRLINEDKVSETYTFQTKDFDGSYNFVLAGDPQIGASGNATNDTQGWQQTLQDSVERFNPNFILSAGDQVNTANNESQYAGYLEHSQLTSVPQATTVGNHDSGSNSYNQHFNLPNETNYGQTTAGSDYWYTYNNTLFMNINTNNMSTAEHKAFMKEAIEKNTDVRWKIVVFHHSIYSVANHAVENDILQRRQELAPVFDDLGIDVVLMGHDHVYVRSHIMKGLQVSQKTTGLSSVTDPDGILYVTANSASGSKYYNIQSGISTDYVDVMDQSKQRSISHIEVSENEFKITTYLYNSDTNEWKNLDQFSIIKSALMNDSEMKLSDETTSVKVEMTIPENTVEKDAVLSVTQIDEGTTYDRVKEEVKLPFTLLDVQLMKNNEVVYPNQDITLQLTLFEKYDVKQVALYRVDNEITEIPFEIIDGKMTLKTNQLGQFVIKDLSSQTNDTPSNTETDVPSNIKTDSPVKTDSKEQGTKVINTGDQETSLAYTLLLFAAAGCMVVLKKKNKTE